MKGAIIHTGARAIACPTATRGRVSRAPLPNGTPGRPHQLRINAATAVTRDANREARTP